MANFKQNHLLTFFCCLFIQLTYQIRGENCTSEQEQNINKPLVSNYKMVALVSILVAGAIGVCFPLLGKTIKALSPEKNIFFIIKAFAAGVILSTGFIHVLPDATEKLTSPCLDKPWQDFPFAGLVAMSAAIATLMIDAFASSYYTRSHFNKTRHSIGGTNTTDEEKKEEHENNVHVHVHTHATHGHAHGSVSMLENSASIELLRYRVVSQVLELGIVVHSVIIGISLGVSEDPKFIKKMVAALTFHQFFEGMGLGGCIAQAKFKSRAIGIMALFFSLTTPVGIAIGIAILKFGTYEENSSAALIVEGMFNSASAGILIYMALVDLLAADFMNPKRQNNEMLQAGASVSLLLGAALMSLLAIWA